MHSNKTKLNIILVVSQERQMKVGLGDKREGMKEGRNEQRGALHRPKVERCHELRKVINLTLPV